MADVDASTPDHEGGPAEEAAEQATEPAANAALEKLYGDKSFPDASLAPDVPLSAVIAACWPQGDDPQVHLNPALWPNATAVCEQPCKPSLHTHDLLLMLHEIAAGAAEAELAAPTCRGWRRSVSSTRI